MDFNRDFSTTDLVALLGAGVAVLAAFLPWVTASVDAGPVAVDASATGLEELGFITLFLGVVVGAVVLVDLGIEETTVFGLAGLVTLLVGIWEFVSLEGAADPGIGLYLTILAGLAILGAGVWDYWTEGERTYDDRS